MAWLILAAAIVAEVGATLALRASEGVQKWGWLPVVAVGYLTAFVLLAVVLRLGMPVGVAYGTWAAGGVALTAVAGAVIFGEAFGWRTLLGIVLIAAGVLLLETGSSTPENPGSSA